MGIRISRSKYRLKIVLLIALGGLVVGFFIFIRNFNSPAVGSINQTPASTNSTKIKSVGNSSYSGKYITLRYPANFELFPTTKDPSYFDVVSLFSNDHLGTHISIGVYQATLANDSGVNYRRLHPEIYKILSQTTSSLVFVDIKNGQEQTGYLAHNGLMASVSVTSNSKQDLSADYSAVANNLVWK